MHDVYSIETQGDYVTYRATDLGSQVALHPTEASAIILKAYRDAGANLRAAAEILGTSERSVHRYVERLRLTAQINALRARARHEGWLKSGRWPEKKDAS
jgi:hypothetical protein